MLAVISLDVRSTIGSALVEKTSPFCRMSRPPLDHFSYGFPIPLLDRRSPGWDMVRLPVEGNCCFDCCRNVGSGSNMLPLGRPLTMPLVMLLAIPLARPLEKPLESPLVMPLVMPLHIPFKPLVTGIAGLLGGKPLEMEQLDMVLCVRPLGRAMGWGRDCWMSGLWRMYPNVLRIPTWMAW